MKSLFEKHGGTYTLGADGIYYSDLVLEKATSTYGKYGMLRKTYLQNHCPSYYSSLCLTGKLIPHLNEIDVQANERMETLEHQMCEQQGVNEQLKAQDQMKWVGMRNNIQSAAEDIILAELIYV